MIIKHLDNAVADFPIGFVDLKTNERKVTLFRVHRFEQHLESSDTGADTQTISVLVYGNPQNGSLVRIHSACCTGESWGAVNCECADQFLVAKSKIVEAGSGIIVYMHGQEGRGAGLDRKIQAIALENNYGLDTCEAYRVLGLPLDGRRYDAAEKIIMEYFGLTKIKLLTNNPDKVHAVRNAGCEVEQVSIWAGLRPENMKYLQTKIGKMGHYRDGMPVIDVDLENPLLFWEASHPFANFYKSAIQVNKKTFATVEHFYQASKFVHNRKIYEAVVNAATPEQAKELSRKHVNSIRADWSEVKDDIMYVATTAKFVQHPELRHALLDTGNRELVEDSPSDSYWGRTKDGGQNRMGAILMRVRNELRELKR